MILRINFPKSLFRLLRRSMNTLERVRIGHVIAKLIPIVVVSIVQQLGNTLILENNKYTSCSCIEIVALFSIVIAVIDSLV